MFRRTISMNMVKSHLLSRSTLSSAIIGVVPKEVGKKDGGDEDKTSMHEVGTAGIEIFDYVRPGLDLKLKSRNRSSSYWNQLASTGLHFIGYWIVSFPIGKLDPRVTVLSGYRKAT